MVKTELVGLPGKALAQEGMVLHGLRCHWCGMDWSICCDAGLECDWCFSLVLGVADHTLPLSDFRLTADLAVTDSVLLLQVEVIGAMCRSSGSETVVLFADGVPVSRKSFPSTVGFLAHHYYAAGLTC